jgi:putative FmdB family regulatory protein|tara:strand:+ start:1250 stop:1609 length:360 start_codon:yes stop_codon:yes gene_type:complete
MPLYEYQCDACGHRFERICKFSDPPLTVCPQCDGVIRKLVSSPAIQFKGTGWYVTDYANKGRSGTEASEAGQSSSDKSTKTDAKTGTDGKATEKKSADAKSSSSSGTSSSSKGGSTSGD